MSWWHWILIYLAIVWAHLGFFRARNVVDGAVFSAWAWPLYWCCVFGFLIGRIRK